MSKATIYDVAGAARVSLATVSRAINNPEKVPAIFYIEKKRFIGQRLSRYSV